MRTEKVLKDAVLCFLRKDSEALLPIKTRNVGERKRNGQGGEMNPGETPEEAAVREVEEETGGIIVHKEHLEKIAILNIHNVKSDGSVSTCRVHVFQTHRWFSESEILKETEEMVDPLWFQIDKLPLEEMMPADLYWLAPALAGEKMFVWFKYGPFQKELLGPVFIQLVDKFDD